MTAILNNNTSRLRGLRGLGDAGEDVFNALKDYLVFTTAPIEVRSKPPGDWFPLVNNTKTIAAGTMLGSIRDYEVTDDDGVWLEGNTVSPGWFKYDAATISLKKKDTKVTLTDQQKMDVMRIIIESVPGGNIATTVADTATTIKDTLEDTFKISTGLIRALPYIVVGAGLLIIYVKFGDDIKAAFTKNKK